MKLDGLDDCTADLVNAAKPPSAFAPSALGTLDGLRSNLDRSRSSLPKRYPDEVVSPFLAVLRGLSQAEFGRALALGVRDGQQKNGSLLEYAARAILDHKCKAKTKAAPAPRKAIAAAHEVVADLYDGFFDRVAEAKVRTPVPPPLAPLVGWYAEPQQRTWTVDQVSVYGLKAPIVMMPVAQAKGGLLAWALLAHEVVGHDVLSAYVGLGDELKHKVWDAMEEANLDPFWRDYWASRVDEAASDVMGVLSMGPAFAIAHIVYLRAQRQINGKPEAPLQIMTTGEADSPYPADFLRAFLVVETVGLLKHGSRDVWADDLSRLVTEALDTKKPSLGKTPVDMKDAMRSAAIMARIVCSAQLDHLKDGFGRKWAIGEFQTWSYEDEHIVEGLRRNKNAIKIPKPNSFDDGPFAAHVVAAAIMNAVATKGQVKPAFTLMVDRLAWLHDVRHS